MSGDKCVCPQCLTQKDAKTDFYWDRRRRDSWCKECRKKKGILDRSKETEDQKQRRYASNAAYVARTPRHRFRRLLDNVPKRAKKQGIPYDLDLEWLLGLFDRQKGRCAVTGILLRFEVTIRKHERDPFAPSIDQIIPGKGYTKDNVRLVCYWANQALGQWGEDAAAELAKMFLEHRESSRIRLQDSAPPPLRSGLTTLR